MNPKAQAYLELALLALAIALFLWWIYPSDPIAVEPTQTATTTAQAKISPFDTLGLEAKSAYVYDALENKAIYEKESELQLPLASLTKIMTALTASTLLPDYSLVRIEPEDLKQEGDSGLFVGEEWNIKDLTDFTLIVSANDGAQALANSAGSRVAYDPNKSSAQLFVERMNTLAQEIGLHETYFLNPSGLDVSTTISGGYGSTKDMALLIDYILDRDPHLLEATSFHKLTVKSKTRTHTAVNTNKVIDLIPTVLASKTGFTDLSGGNLVVAFDAGVGHPVIIALLGSSYEGRFSDMQKLVDTAVNYLSHTAQ